ncbi:MAG: hypothetical protein ABL900_16735 [Burkholderiaceae bacterium]
MKRNAPPAQHTALSGAVAACWRAAFARTSGMQILLATLNLLPQISARP